MSFRWDYKEHLRLIGFFCKWLLIAVPLGGAVGAVCFLFLWLLHWATEYRETHPWMLYLLPIAGVAIIFAYRKAGKSVERGNNLIIDAIHDSEHQVPLRMTPLVLISTIVTHLFGGSAGREGTAVQMGGSIAGKIAQILKLNHAESRLLLMTGMAAGFGAVFGTPIAAAIFAMEVLAIGRIRYEAIIPCLIGGIAGDRICTALGAEHTHYMINSAVHGSVSGAGLGLSQLLLLKVAIAGIFFGLAGALFAGMMHKAQAGWQRYVKNPYLPPVIGGIIIITLVYLLGTTDYLGLGIHSTKVSITSAFEVGGSEQFSWLWKILFTVITLSAGFKGGEVTPLFFIGATLGNTLAGYFGAPVDLMAAVGFIAVFAGATNTPLACTIMGIELFGAEYAVYFATGCFIAYLFSGHNSIYHSQRIETRKY